MVIEYDGNRLEDDFYFGVILNTNEFGGIIKLDKQPIKLNDGIFDMLLVKEVGGVFDAFSLLHKIRMQNFNNDKMIRLSVSSLKITSNESLAWTIDGEYGGNYKDIEFEVLPSKVNLVADSNRFFTSNDSPESDEEHVFSEELMLMNKRKNK